MAKENGFFVLPSNQANYENNIGGKRYCQMDYFLIHISKKSSCCSNLIFV